MAEDGVVLHEGEAGTAQETGETVKHVLERCSIQITAGVVRNYFVKPIQGGCQKTWRNDDLESSANYVLKPVQFRRTDRAAWCLPRKGGHDAHQGRGVLPRSRP